MTCCKDCGSCDGGEPSEAWKYYKTNGIVTGGLYEVDDWCEPYSLPPCAHHIASPKLPSCPTNDAKTP